MNTSNDPPFALPRVLGLWTATAIVAGTIIGSGIFFKVQCCCPGGTVYRPCRYCLAGRRSMTPRSRIDYLEVCVLLPRSGGNYVFFAKVTADCSAGCGVG
jgi:hypothetical protein